MSADVVYDLAEPIVGYRSWRIFGTLESGHRLAALSFSTAWKREMTAKPCAESSTHFVGALACDPISPCDGPPCSGRSRFRPNVIGQGCGIYALKYLGTALLGMDSSHVLGKVLLGGRVWPHATGYRAEKAQIAGLYGPDSFARFQKYLEWRQIHCTPWIHEIAKVYAVPIIEPTGDEEIAMLTAALEEDWVMHRLSCPL